MAWLGPAKRSLLSPNIADVTGAVSDKEVPTDLAAYCPRFHHTIELIGRRWTGAALMALSTGCASFGEIRDAIPGISDRLLSERLKELEAEGIVTRHVDGRSTRYALTDKGCALDPVLRSISTYAEQWGGAASAGQ